MYEALSNSAEIVAGVLGIAVTVVAIIVELAATRYTHRISDMFIRDPVNVVTLAFFVATTLACVWVAATSSPTGSSTLHEVTMVMVTLSLVGLLPYFAYVFSFISPISVIRRISRRTRARLERPTPYRPAVANAIDEIQDVLRGAIDRGDRAIAMTCIDTLAGLVVRYQELRHKLSDDWYRMDEQLNQDPDFISLEALAIEELETHGTWFEFKVFAQFHTALALALPRLRDVANLISIHTRRLASEVAAPDSPLQLLCLTAFNSYLRATINARDPRTSYYILSQYRQAAEALLHANQQEAVATFARRLQFYGQLAFDTNQAFLLEVCAYDLVQLMEHCSDDQTDLLSNLVGALVELDREIDSPPQEHSLLGVRRAQLRAAVLLLERQEAELADVIVEDMRAEPRERMSALIQGLIEEREQRYWELTPRGINFGYLAPEHHGTLNEVARLLETPTP